MNIALHITSAVFVFLGPVLIPALMLARWGKR